MKTITNEEVVQMTNDKKRKAFLSNYKEWEVVSKNDYTRETYFECILPNGIRVVACEERKIKEVNPSDKAVIEFFYMEDRGPWAFYSFRSYKVAESVIVNALRALRTELLKKE